LQTFVSTSCISFNLRPLTQIFQAMRKRRPQTRQKITMLAITTIIILHLLHTLQAALITLERRILHTLPSPLASQPTIIRVQCMSTSHQYRHTTQQIMRLSQQRRLRNKVHIRASHPQRQLRNMVHTRGFHQQTHHLGKQTKM
jgi:hypothetical protein